MMSLPSRRALLCPRCLAPVSVVTAHTASYYDPHFTHSCGFKGVLRWSRPARARRTSPMTKPKRLRPTQCIQTPKQPVAAKGKTELQERGAATARMAQRNTAPATKLRAVKSGAAQSGAAGGRPAVSQVLPKQSCAQPAGSSRKPAAMSKASRAGTAPKIAVGPAQRATEAAPTRPLLAKASSGTSARPGSKRASSSTARRPASSHPAKKSDKRKGRAPRKPNGPQHSAASRPVQEKPVAAVSRRKAKPQAAAPTSTKSRHRAA